MSNRSLWKGPFITNKLFDEVKKSSKNFIKTTSRASVVLPCLIGKMVHVHNGKFYIPIFISEDMVGHKLGEFVITRLRHVYKKKK